MYFSIITVVLNDCEGLQRTIDSVIGQGCEDYELIIKDGGSIDGTVELIERIEKDYDTIHVVQGHDEGIYDAMNCALSVAKGEYVIFLNAGDVLVDSDVLDQVRPILEDQCPDVLFGKTRMVFENGYSFDRHVKPVEYIKYGQPAIHQSTFFRVACHQRHLYDTKYRISADYAVLCSMFMAGVSFSSIDMCISCFEVSKDGASYKGQSQSRKEMAMAQRIILKENIGKIAYYWLRRLVSNQVFRLLMVLK